MPSSHSLRFRRDHRWTPGRLSAHLDDDLAPAERRRVLRHTDECPECRGLLHSLRKLVGVLGAPRPVEPVADRLLAELRTALARDDHR